VHPLIPAPLRAACTVAAQRFATFDDSLDAWTERHWSRLRILGYVAAFAALAGSVAHHAFVSGFARALIIAECDECPSTAGLQLAAAMQCGAAAILFVRIYVASTLGLHRIFIDPWQYVRPEPPSRTAARWTVYLHGVIGLVLFFTIAGLGQLAPPDTMDWLISMQAGKIHLGSRAMLEWILGWCLAGSVVLKYFWSRSRAAAETKGTRR
jgi:hypothetical protein